MASPPRATSPDATRGDMARLGGVGGAFGHGVASGHILMDGQYIQLICMSSLF